MNYIDSPNIFDYATSELSQDAALCYYLAKHEKFAGNKGEPDVQQACSHAFLLSLVKDFTFKGEEAEDTSIKGKKLSEILKDPQNINSIQVKRQVRLEMDTKIVILDILVTIFLKSRDEIDLIIEDKVNASESKGQLDSYIEAIAERVDIVKENTFVLYFKTKPECAYNLDQKRKKGVGVYTREDFLACLEPLEDDLMADQIMYQFYIYLKRSQNDFDNYKNEILDGEESIFHRPAFFSILDEEFKKQKADFVYKWYYKNHNWVYALVNKDEKDENWLQLELVSKKSYDASFRLKMHIGEELEDHRKKIRTGEFAKNLIEKYKAKGYDIKPNGRVGKYMSFAEIDPKINTRAGDEATPKDFAKKLSEIFAIMDEEKENFAKYLSELKKS